MCLINRNFFDFSKLRRFRKLTEPEREEIYNCITSNFVGFLPQEDRDDVCRRLAEELRI